MGMGYLLLKGVIRRVFSMSWVLGQFPIIATLWSRADGV